MLREDPPTADPARTAETMQTARWQVRARRMVVGSRGIVSVLLAALRTLVSPRPPTSPK